MSTKISKEAFEYLNKLRANPLIAIPILEERRKYFKGNKLCLPNSQIQILTKEGTKAFDECIQFLKVQKPVNELKYSELLEKACLDHVNDLGPKGMTGHDGSDKSQPWDRIERHGDWMGTVGENISFGEHAGEEVILQLIVDDGILDRGHRTNCFKDEFNFVGIADGYHKIYKTCCVMDFAGEIYEKGKKQVMIDNLNQQMEDLTNQINQQQVQDGEPDFVSKNVSTEVSIKNGKKHTKVTTVYEMADGSTQTQIKEIIEG